MKPDLAFLGAASVLFAFAACAETVRIVGSPETALLATGSDASVRTLRRAAALEAAEKAAAAERAKALAHIPCEVVYVTHAQFAGDHHNTATLFQCGEVNERSYRTQGALKAWNPKTGETRVIVPEKPGRTVRNPCVSFDGKTILFSMRDGAADDYHLYTVGADGSGLRQLTSAKGVSDFDPAWLPDGDIVFSSTREPKYCMCNRHIMGNLFRMKADGANIHQIGKSTLFEGHSAVLGDGRILYDRWEYVDRNFGDAQGLWVCNPDGTNHQIFWGNNTTSPGGVIYGRPLSTPERVIAVMGSCHDRPWGALALLDRALGLDGRDGVVRTWPDSYRGMIHTDGRDFDSTKSIALKFADPCVLDDAHFLCTRQVARGREEMGLCYVDLEGAETILLKEKPGIHNPVLLRPRKKPPALATRRNFDAPNAPGRFYVHDVYAGTHMKGVKRGAVKALRIVESPEKRSWIRCRGWFGDGEQAAAMNWSSFENKRILGTVPVEEDGSAYFETPANTFVFFQALDGEGKLVQSMRSGTYLQPGETQGCVGCHEYRNDAASMNYRETPKALKRAPSKLAGWLGAKPKLFSFRKEVQPVFDRSCVKCHDYPKAHPGNATVAKAGKKLNLSGDRGAFFSTGYADLWALGIVRCVGGGAAEVRPAYSWGSHASPLTKALYGHGGTSLTEEERTRVITWMDLNAPYYPTYDCAFPTNRGGRMPISFADEARLTELAGSKIANGCGARQREQLDFDRPELSRILDSPGAATNRVEMLAILGKGQAALAATPRADSEGFVPCADDREREARYARRRAVEEEVYRAIRENRRVYDER